MNLYAVGTHPVLTAQFLDPDGDPFDPAGITAQVTKPSGAVDTYTAGQMGNPSVGTWTLEVVADQLGTWTYQFLAPGVTPSSEHFRVLAAVPTSAAAVCRPWVDVPASVSLSVDPLMACPGLDLGDPAVRAAAVLMAEAASGILNRRTGNRFPGPCVVRRHLCPGRPCRPLFGDPTSSLARSAWLDAQPFPSPTTGTALVLPGQVESVLSVEVDGAILDPADYRVAGSTIYRCDGLPWPACPDPCAGDSLGLVVEWSYATPPLEGRLAAARLTCELLRSHLRQASALPAGATTVSRQNVTITRELLRLIEAGQTGIFEVDSFIGAYGRAEPAVLFPEQVRPRNFAAEGRPAW